MEADRIERIKELVERGYSLGAKNAERLIERIEYLEEENRKLLSVKEVTVNVPPLPESYVIDILQKQVESLQVQLAHYSYRRTASNDRY